MSLSQTPELGVRANRVVQDELDTNRGDALEALRQLHDAAQVGDVTACADIFDKNKDIIHVNSTRRGRNTVLQEGPLVDYLIDKGALLEAENNKGCSPIVLAIMNCRGCKAVAKLINAGAKYKQFKTGKYRGMSAMDVAVKYKNDSVVQLLKRLGDEENDTCVATVSDGPVNMKARATCPICKMTVKMSRIESDQMHIERRVKSNGDFSQGSTKRHKQKKYIARKYMDELLANKEAYRKLCGIEYHHVENMRIRKEISESMGVLHAVANACGKLGIAGSDGGLSLRNVFIVDLCSGKGMTTAICGAMNEDASNNKFLAIDKMLPHTVPHFIQSNSKLEYLCRDVMSEELCAELEGRVKEQVAMGRVPILVGMHLCGLLSDQAITFFDRIHEIKAIVLSPCCLPTKRDQTKLPYFQKEKADDPLHNYFLWARYLKGRIEGRFSETVRSEKMDVSLYTDSEMHTEKNALIVGLRNGP